MIESINQVKIELGPPGLEKDLILLDQSDYTRKSKWLFDWENESENGVYAQQLQKEKTTVDDRLTETLALLTEEEDKTKQVTKQKNKLESIIADLEERLRREQEVS